MSLERFHAFNAERAERFIIALLGSLPFARQLNVLARGELQAHVLGTPVRALRIGIFALWPFGKTVVRRADAGAGSAISDSA